MIDIRQFDPSDIIRLPLDRKPELAARLRNHLREEITGLKDGLRDLHEKVTRWRKTYEAVPAEAVREFPWHGASNLVVPIVAIHTDTLLARVMSAVLKTRPPWVCSILGGSKMDGADEIKSAMEQYLEYVSMEPTELDLPRVYQEWFGEAIRYGTSIVKCPIDQVLEDLVTPAGDGSGSFEYNRDIIYEGPRPEKVMFQDFLIAPSAKTIERATFKAHRVRLSRIELQERRYNGVYDAEAVARVLATPDRTAPDSIETTKQSDVGAHDISTGNYAEWDIYECHFKFRIEADHFVKAIVFYHLRSQEILRAYFNYYPLEIFVAARLFFRDDMFHGYGFVDMLDDFQEEVSQIHNQRRDNSTIANTRAWRADPDSNLHQGYKIFPSALLPARKDEIEPLAPGEISSITIDEERLSLELAERRSGVTPAQQGAGSGGPKGSKVPYSAMGTLSVLQEGNSRTDLNISDIRYAHGKLGRVILTERAMLGLGRHKEAFQEIGVQLEKAFALLRKGQLVIPIQSSNASINREVEKQNDLMLMKMMEGHYSAMNQLYLQALDPRLPPQTKQFNFGLLKAMTLMARGVLRHFGYEQVEELAPEPPEPSDQSPEQAPVEGGAAGGAGAPSPGQQQGGGGSAPAPPFQLPMAGNLPPAGGGRPM